MYSFHQEGECQNENCCLILWRQQNLSGQKRIPPPQGNCKILLKGLWHSTISDYLITASKYSNLMPLSATQNWNIIIKPLGCWVIIQGPQCHCMSGPQHCSFHLPPPMPPAETHSCHQRHAHLGHESNVSQPDSWQNKFTQICQDILSELCSDTISIYPSPVPIWIFPSHSHSTLFYAFDILHFRLFSHRYSGPDLYGSLSFLFPL